MSTATGKKSLKKVLFLEIAGFLSLIVTVGVVFMVLAMHTTDLTLMIVPFAGLLVTCVFILVTISYMRKDLHKIHELHSKSIYAVGRYFIYLIGIALIAYAAYLFFTAKEFWNDIGLVVVSNVSVIVGVFAIFYTGTMGYLIQHEHLRHKSVSFWDMFVLVLFPVGLISASVYTMFSQKASTVTEGKADFEISADKLIGEFEKDTKAASEKYIGKSVLFHGRVTEVAGDSSVLLKLASNQEGFTTNCGFDKSVYHEVKTVQSGDSVAVQCSCSGITKPEGEMDLLSESSLDMVRCKLLQIIKTKP